ncbi:MAG: SDR family NAD(P)-dependent oxidoreductase [Mycobacteriaceae bacterium]|nr:SDR family NAD(P)-dependent oxidoreductase [Mycobacteriaceae bacterium]
MSAHKVGRSLLDTLLDRTVVPGYTSLGFRIRRSDWVNDPAPEALRGRTALVTGASRGLGTAIAAGLAELGATVVLVVRDRERGERARDELAAAHPTADFVVQVCDIANLGAVRDFAAELTTELSSLDIIIHNAGVLPNMRTETCDGHELTLATHVLGPVLLTELLTPVLARSNDPRVILMSSGGMYTQALPVHDPEYRRGRYRGTNAYARTKRMQVAFTPILAKRWAPQGVSVYCMHPGWADTPGVAESLPAFRKLTGPLLRSPSQGADTAVWLAATTPTPPAGLFWHDRRPRPEHYLPFTRENSSDRQRIWQYCAQALGIDHP